MTVDIICADARDALARFPDGHFHCCVTSPPFWGLRDYGLEPTVWGGDGCEHEWGEAMVGDTRADNFKDWTNLMRAGEPPPEAPHVKRPQGAFCRRCNAWRGTLGLEPTPELYVEHLVGVMREVRRVLRDDGVLWLNLGDSYTSGGRKERDPGQSKLHPAFEGENYPDGLRPDTPLGLKPKDLVGVPWMVAFALRADGWWLRSDVVWSKPNPMPESVRDRPTRSHEYLFLLTKRERYYYDQDAIREPGSNNSHGGGLHHEGRYSVASGRMDGGGENFSNAKPAGAAGRNRRSVWEIATQPYPNAHFATFPEKLVEPCILAGTSEWGCCPECGAPWERVSEKPQPPDEMRNRDDGTKMAYHSRQLGGGQKLQDWYDANPGTTVGWRPTCKHGAEPVPCRVLDPFAGSGTVGVVAERLGRHSVLIDAKEEYCLMAQHRTAQRGLMVEAT